MLTKKVLYLLILIIAFKQAGAQNALYDTGSVKKYYAKGDGIADDTKALQDAINAMKGAPVYLPPGGYLITQTLVPASSKTRIILIGSDDNATYLIAANNFSGAMINVKKSITIKNINFKGNTKEGTYGIRSTDGFHGNVIMENLKFTGFDYAIRMDDKSEFPLMTKLDNIYIQNVLTCGIKMGTDSAPTSGQSLLELNNIVVTNSGMAGILFSKNSLPQNSEFGWCLMNKLSVLKTLTSKITWETTRLIQNGPEAASYTSNADYKVIKCTAGVSFSNFKAVNAGVIQCEYVGVGCYFNKIIGMHIGSVYYEYRTNYPNPIPRGNAIMLKACNGVTISSGWIEGAFSAVSVINCWGVKVSGLVTNSCSRSIINVYAPMPEIFRSKRPDLIFDNTLSSISSIPVKIGFTKDY